MPVGISKTPEKTRIKRSLSLMGHAPWNKKHGMDGTSVYKCWIGLKARCFNKSDKDYDRYGGRGITVCDFWKLSFENFYKDMGDKPSKGHSIDRINVHGNYCKENCRWATIAQQNSNKSNNHKLCYDGKKLTVTEWSRRVEISQTTLLNRILRGWTIEKTLTYPVQKHKKLKNIK